MDPELDTDTTDGGSDTPDTDTGAVDTTTTTDTGDDAAPTSTADAVKRALAGDEDEPPAAAAADDAAGKDTEGDDPAGKPDTAADDAAKAEAELQTPEGLKADAKERFEKLVSRVRESGERIAAAEAERDDVKGQYETVVKVMEDTGAPPEQFAQTLVMLGYANSGDPAKIGQALDMLDAYRAELARKVGRVLPGVDVLDGFPDLRTKVDNGDMDEAGAAEIAAARRDRASRDAAGKRQEQDAAAQGQLQHRIEKAQGDLTTLGTALKAKDPDFQRKLDVLGKRGFFDQVSKNSPPEQWGNLFQIAYDALGDVAAVRTPAPKKHEQPLRSTPEGGGGKAQPKTTADAVRLALAED